LAIRAYEQALSADPRLANPATRLQELHKP
jgi:hypothetical protein